MDADEKEDLKAYYKTALDTRNFEISLFWQRSNYFLVLNSALALGFFNLQKREYQFFLATFGLIVSWLWFRVNLGSKFWQSRWEYRLREIENKIAPRLHFFATDLATVKEDVENDFKSNKHKGYIRRRLDKLTLRKPSVSGQMIWLSILFLLGWALLFVSSSPIRWSTWYILRPSSFGW
ncbi:MAG: hypothetical protein QOJ70_1806 [Acidobacteriota bacterium]|jgi:hypothetical protein|nr:hypothetical protein [Acidobacteriota bacterium]